VDGFSIKVIDRVTQKPIDGALVIASFIARSGSHDSTLGLSNGLETLTGKDVLLTFLHGLLLIRVLVAMTQY